jgi:hypothetical protein
MEKDLQEIKFELSRLIRDEIRVQLAQPRTVKTYDGRSKPVSGNYSLAQKRIDNTGVLSASVQVYFTDTGDEVPTLVVDFGNTDYWYYIDQGRKPGRYPPVDSIKQWIRQKPALTGLQTSIDQKAFLVGRSIARDGMFPNNFIDKALKNVQAKVEAGFEEYGVAVLLAVIDKGPVFKSNNIRR